MLQGLGLCLVHAHFALVGTHTVAIGDSYRRTHVLRQRLLKPLHLHPAAFHAGHDRLGHQAQHDHRHDHPHTRIEPRAAKPVRYRRHYRHPRVAPV